MLLTFSQDPYVKGRIHTLSIANIGKVASNSLTASALALDDGFFLAATA